MTNFSDIPWIAAHIELYQTDPEKAHNWDSSELGGPSVLPTLLLTTKGRISGEPRLAPNLRQAGKVSSLSRQGWHAEIPCFWISQRIRTVRYR